MCSSKVAIALIGITALAYAAPELQRIRIRGDVPNQENSGLGGLGSLGAILPVGGEGGVGGATGGLGGVGGIVGGLLGNGGDSNILGNILGALGPNGLPLLGNVTDLPTEVLDQVTSLLGSGLPIDQIVNQLETLIPGGLDGLLQLVLQVVAQLLDAISQVLSNLPTVLDQLIAILNNKDQSADQQTQAIDDLKTQFPVEFDTILYIVSQLTKSLQGGQGGIVPELPGVPSVPETPQVPVPI